MYETKYCLKKIYAVKTLKISKSNKLERKLQEKRLERDSILISMFKPASHIRRFPCDLVRALFPLVDRAGLLYRGFPEDRTLILLTGVLGALLGKNWEKEE